MRSAAQNAERHENRSGNRKESRRCTPEHQEKLKSIKRKLSQTRRERSQIAGELRAARRGGNRAERVEQIKRRKNNKQEIFRLQNELRRAKERTQGEPETGALPDFLIIGAPKCGTTFLYHLLTKHLHIEPAAFKEPHYFDLLFDKGTEWYRQCFLPPRWEDGQWTITGEATPGYLRHPRAPERVAQVVPQAQLIALLRNPVDQIYSAYHYFQVRHGLTMRTFEETIEDGSEDLRNEVLSQGIYVDQLLRWSKFFRDEQMLVLKSESLFERPQETLKRVLDFLALPDWEPEASDLHDKRNRGKYEQTMDLNTRRRLEHYFEPYNRRLYSYLGVDFGW
jgi:hypothetical protein